MILIDTSIWIEIFGPRPPKSFKAELLLQTVICPPILQEVVQGVREEKVYLAVLERLQALPLLESSVGLDCFLSAAEIFRSGRKKGITIRSSVDCLIAAIAIKHRTPVWHRERDFAQIAKFTSLAIYQPL